MVVFFARNQSQAKSNQKYQVVAPTATRSSPSPSHLHWSRHEHLNISVGVWRPRAFALQENWPANHGDISLLLRSLLRIVLLVFWRARQCPGKGSLNLSVKKMHLKTSNTARITDQSCLIQYNQSTYIILHVAVKISSTWLSQRRLICGRGWRAN